MENRIWQFNEMIQVGASHSELSRAKAYDENMLKFRNYEKEAEIIISNLDLKKDDTIIDFGCGTGALTIEFAKKCKRVIAVDVAKPMLEILKEKAEKMGVSNIEYVNAGYLTYNHLSKPVDIVITKAAFHHLPDFWKVVALDRINKMIKKSGKLFLSDVIFSFDIENYAEEIDKFINTLREMTSEKLYNDAILHVREEFSTFDWVMDEFLKKTNFEIVKKDVRTKTNIDYYCVKL